MGKNIVGFLLSCIVLVCGLPIQTHAAEAVTSIGIEAPHAVLMEASTGTILYEKDAHFISYTFLHDNILPLDDDDELSGIFHLLASEWYNSANRYLRANAAYVSPFLVLQKVLPRVNIFKNEMLFFNLLFISDLCPYTEFGYGVETPYVNLGVFAGFENSSFHKFGFKVTVSLFDN